MVDEIKQHPVAEALAGIQQECQALRQQLWQLSRCLARQARQAILDEPRFADPLRLERFGFKVHSQNDEDGYLHEILRRLGIARPSFVEMGVGDGLENNTHFLLAQGCRGQWIEADTGHCLQITNRFASYLQRQHLTVANRFVRPQFVDAILGNLSVPKEVDVLSIDIDGQDYYVWQALTHTTPKVVVIEYNGKLPPPVALVQPDKPDRCWDGSDGFGASLCALEQLGRSKGYCLVGCEIVGSNAFFVREELVAGRFQRPFTAENHYHPCRYELTCAGAFTVGHPATATNWVRLDATSAAGAAP